MDADRHLLRIAIPLLSAATAAAAENADEPTVARPEPFVTAEEWGSTPSLIPDERRHTPRYITLHHAGVTWTADRNPEQFLRNLQSWGKRRPELEQPPRDTYWPDLPYHFLIAPDGRIFEGRSIEYEPESNTDYDLSGHLGVELMGNFEAQRPSPAQIEAAVRLVAWLLSEHDLTIDVIRTHAQVADGQTSCPGRDFARYVHGDNALFQQWVAEVLQGRQPEIDAGPPLPDGPTEVIPTEVAHQ